MNRAAPTGRTYQAHPGDFGEEQWDVYCPYCGRRLSEQLPTISEEEADDE